MPMTFVYIALACVVSGLVTLALMAWDRQFDELESEGSVKGWRR